jgi:penicillin-insensitive murein endopeptidase
MFWSVEALAGSKTAAKSPPSAPAAIARVPPDVSKLGPLSVGHPHEGYLVNAVKMPTGPGWVLTVPGHGFGTQEAVDALSHCLTAVHEQFPGSPPVMLGSLSAERGGLLPPHESHRSGRDADVYFFRKPGATWSRAATEADIDLPRTWALLRCFITDADVDMILIVRKVQNWIEDYALSIGEPKAWIDDLFHDRGTAKTAIVRDVPGHVAHMHVRFVSPKARRAAVAAYDRLVATGAVQPRVAATEHRVSAGDTLSELAEVYKTTVARIQERNGLKSTLIKLGQKLTIQQRVDLRGARDAVVIPPRRRPPASVPKATVERFAATPPARRPVSPQARAPQTKPRVPGPNGTRARRDRATSEWL